MDVHCPVKYREGHLSIKIYNCGKHGDEIGLSLVGLCRICFSQNRPLNDDHYCGSCLALYNTCEICGITPDGRYPMRPVAKMLGTENGRRGK
jgi:hypothetical protein